MRSNNRRWVAVVVDDTGSNTEEENDEEKKKMVKPKKIKEDGRRSKSKIKTRLGLGWIIRTVVLVGK